MGGTLTVLMLVQELFDFRRFDADGMIVFDGGNPSFLDVTLNGAAGDIEPGSDLIFG